MCRRGCTIFLLACLLLTVTAACGDGGKEAGDAQHSTPSNPTSLSAQPLPGRLLFSRFDESSHTFLSTHVSRPDGSDEEEVPMPGPEGGGRWSRSGDQIAVMTVLEDDRIGTAIIRPDGVVVRLLAIPDKTLNLVCTVWSPDDERLACEGWDDGDPSRRGIYTVRSSDGGGLVRLTEPPADRGDLPGDYSPDGGLLLFKRAADEEEGPLMVVPTAGGEARALSDEQFEDPGRYSPDGESILTTSNGSIVLLDSEGRPVGRIAEDGHFLFGAVWSPDGVHIAFSDATTGPFADVFTSLPDGTDKRRVTDTPENEIGVEWGAG